MRFKAILTLTVVLLTGSLLSASQAQRYRPVKIEQASNLGKIRVLLEKEIDAANIEVRGGYKIYDPRTASRVGKGVLNKQYLVRPTLDGIAWGEGYPGVFQIQISPNDPSTSILVNGTQYAGDIFVYQIGNSISIVNEVPIEDFVKSMLNPKIDAELHPEVLASIAIVMRTQAYFYALKNENSFWHLDGKKIEYLGRSVCSRNNGVDKAVDLTHHLVMKARYNGMKEGFFDATTTVNCAGKTVPYHLIFKKEGYCPRKGVESPLAQARRNQHVWKAEITASKLSERLNFGVISGFEVLKDTTSSKAYALKLDSGEESIEIDFLKLQEILGANYLKSPDFDLNFKDSQFIFRGHGEGTGVGLCLFSAQEMAKRDQTASEILEHFFPGADIRFMEVKKSK